MSDVFGKTEAQELQNIKVSEPSIAYAGKEASKDVLFALNLPYRLCKSWYDAAQQESRAPEVDVQKYKFVEFLEKNIPEKHFCFSSEDTVRKNVNERLRKLCSVVSQKYKSSRGMARMKLDEMTKTFHVLKGETESIDKMKDEIKEWKQKCKDLDERCSILLEEIQALAVESSIKDKVIEELKSTNQELLRYVESLQAAQGLNYQGKPIHESKNKQRTLKEFINRANVALWYAKAFGIELKSMNLIETNSGKEHFVVLNEPACTSNTANQGNQKQTQYEKLPETEKSKIQEVLFLLDKFCVGDNFYHELSMVSSGLPKSYLIKQCRDNYNSLSHIESLPNNYQGAKWSFTELLTLHTNAFLESNPDFDITKEKLKIKINGDGARMTRNSNFILLSFSILQTGANVMSAKGNRTIAAVNASESYETLEGAFGSIFEEINSFIDSGKLTINNKTINLDFFLGGDYKFILLMLGLKGATSNYACAWCKVHKDDRWITSNDFNYYNKSPMSRTLQEILQLYGKSKANYCCDHKPLINIELDHVIVDELHLMLRITDVLTNNIVNEVIDWDREDDWDKTAREEKGIHLKHLIATIRSLGVSFDVWEQRNADNSSSGKYDWTSLMGTEKKILLNHLPSKLVNILRPATSSAVSKLWLNFSTLYNLINKWEPNTLPSTFATQAGEWIDEFCSLSGKLDGYEKARVTPYMHIMFAHIPFFFKLYKGVKIFTGQGVEKNNDVARSVVHRKSNKWDAIGDVLQLEHRQWHLRESEREKRSYSKHKSSYWETDIKSSRQKRRRVTANINPSVDLNQGESSHDPPENNIDPDKMTVKELKKELTDRNIKGLSKKSKAELILLLKEALSK